MVEIAIRSTTVIKRLQKLTFDPTKHTTVDGNGSRLKISILVFVDFGSLALLDTVGQVKVTGGQYKILKFGTDLGSTKNTHMGHQAPFGVVKISQQCGIFEKKLSGCTGYTK